MMAAKSLIVRFLFTWLILLSRKSSSAFQCGILQPGIGLVYGSEVTKQSVHPWKVALLDTSKGQNYFCGGVLIDDETVLTAAHCLDGKDGNVMKPEDVSVLLGAYNITQQSETRRVSILAEIIYIHKKWNSSSDKFNNDVALIKLKEIVHFNHYIQPVCLPTTEITTIGYGTVFGWGFYDDNHRASSHPRKVEMSILEPFDCMKRNYHLAHIFDIKTMFCAGKDEAYVFPADSGSGFYVEKDGRFYVRGIVSSGAGYSCSKMSDVLYSDVLKNLEFLNKHIMNEKVNANCIYDWEYMSLTCFIEDLNVNSPNFRIGRINTSHEEGKSDLDVETIYIRESNFFYLPTFQDGYLERKFVNLKTLVFDGENGNMSMVSVTKTNIPKGIENIKLYKFGKRLNKLPADMLEKNLQLKYFKAGFNNIEHISENLFSGKTKLEVCHLEDNFLKSLPGNIWNENTKVHEIRIGTNLLKSLPENLLKNLVDLIFFSASENEIESIHQTFFHSNEKLEKVYLYKNKITSLPDNLFANNRNMKIIDFENNKIKSLPPNLIANAPLLETFEAGNSIRTEPEGFRKNNPNLKTFNIQFTSCLLHKIIHVDLCW